MILFLGTIKYDKVGEDGLQKTVSEKYLFQAEDFTQAEQFFQEQMSPFMSGEYAIAELKPQKVAEVLHSGDSLADKWFLAKVAFITLDEKTAKEKRTIQKFYVQATDFKNALSAISAELGKCMGEWLIVSLAETPVVDFLQSES